ncbi:PREDICTED: transcription factor GTE4-like isoform X2 [Lupinus angustifolius]|uniref:transcription factor GTE4-like isoform X2 n=1 Tax=Lupinus angustifolius TaxID=3871 RepID=UPI00092E876C|nr:PREDICTED: transcription factor GTE4-like isoform X2 [Lupinus angustifolius]
MASGHIVGGDDGDRERKRFLEGKVYTRRRFKSTKKDPTIVNTVTPATATAENDSATIAATSITANNSDNNSPVKCRNPDEAKSDTKVISAAALPVAVPEDGNPSQPQGNSPEDRNSAQIQVNSGVDENLTQKQVCSREDENVTQKQVCSREDENLAQKQVNSREDENMAQLPVNSTSVDVGSAQPQADSMLEDVNSIQPEVETTLEDVNSAKLQVDSTLEDWNSSQPRVNSTLVNDSSAQPQVDSALEEVSLARPVESSTLNGGNLVELPVDSILQDGNLAQPQVDSTLKDGNMAQLPVNSTSVDVGSAQPQADSMLEDVNSIQPEVETTLEDVNSAKLQVDSTLEDWNSSQPRVNSTLVNDSSAQPQVDSALEEVSLARPVESSTLNGGNLVELPVDSILQDGNLAQPQVDSTLKDVNLAQPELITSLEDQISAQPVVLLVSDDLCSRQQDAVPMIHDLPSGNGAVELQQDDDRTSIPSLQQEMIPSTQDLPSGNGDVEPQQDDSRHSSHSHHLDMIPSTQVLPSGNGAVEPRMEDRIKINLTSKSKQEMQELRWKLEGELNIVRSLVKRIEMKQGQVDRYGNLIGKGRVAIRAHSEVASAGVPRESTRPLHHLNLSMLENSHAVNESVEREKRMPKANQFYHNSEFLLAKDKFPPVESNKKSKLHWKKQSGGEMAHGHWMGSKFFKSCSSLLEKLMKHKHGWVFNAPVDVEGLGLHDYFTIVTHPMDLGTVKSRLSKNWYKSPKEFAEDVRLTFRNAMTYNPKGHDVHVMAEQLSKIFEDRWAIIESDYNREMRYGIDYGAALSAPSPLSRRVPAFPPAPLDMRILNRSESMTQTPRPMRITPSSRTPALKKPKAKDPDKRDMTFDEKQKLSTNLQSLPSDKLDAIVQIIKKRNSALHQHDDEIEVDIDSVDAETLWELDRFVTNYKKSLSKNKRKAELAQARANAVQNALRKSWDPVMVEVPRETQADERNIPPSLPVQEGNQAGNGNRPSSSSSSSSDSGSSSSDSDSDSSSASGSEEGS